jgi:hypothetical protein
MTEPKADTVSLGNYAVPIDCYMMPNGEFRVSITGVSVVLGYQKDWLLTLPSNLPKLRALQNGGFTYTPKTVFIQRAETISIKDLTTLITLEAFSGIHRLEALSGNKRAMALQAAFTLEGLDALFRDTFEMPQKLPDERQSSFRGAYEDFLEVFEKNQAELNKLRLLSDPLYFTQHKQD